MERDPAVDAYVRDAPEGRRDALAAIRQACLEELDGFTEGMAYGMPSYERDGEVEVAFANQKQYLSLYVLTDVVEAHRDGLAELDVGKSCIRFRRPAAVDLDLVRTLLRATVATGGPSS